MGSKLKPLYQVIGRDKASSFFFLVRNMSVCYKSNMMIGKIENFPLCFLFFIIIIFIFIFNLNWKIQNFSPFSSNIWEKQANSVQLIIHQNKLTIPATLKTHKQVMTRTLICPSKLLNFIYSTLSLRDRPHDHIHGSL